MSLVSVGRLLKKLGMSPQRPTHRALQRDELSVFKWMTEDFPTIRRLAKEQDAEIFFGEESSVRSDYHSGTAWAPIWKTPIVKTTGSRHRVNLILAISPRGAMQFMATEGSVTPAVFIDFLKALLHKAIRPVFLIVDNHSVHRTQEVHKFVKSTKCKLHLFFLPPYSPELNPDEHVWNYLKNHKIGRQSAKNGFELSKRCEKIMFSLQRFPEKIKSFFKHLWTKYVAMSGNECTA